MRKLTVFKLVRDPNNNDKVLGKRTLRQVSVHDSFIGIKEKGVIDKSEFKKLADILEPSNDGFHVV